MTCEWAEGYLSAYLDTTLDPSLRAEVSEHLASCERCRATLADYRRYDALLANSIRVTPPESLRDRIFASPEFATILQSSARQNERRAARAAQPPHATQAPTSAPGPRWRVPTPPSTAAPPIETRTADDGDLAPRHQPAALTDAPATDAPTRLPSEMPGRKPHRLPVAKLLLPVAAALIVALGVSAFFSQGFGALRPHAPASGANVYGAPDFSTAPLAAGARLVFAHNGALWSAPEVGASGAPSVAQRLTPPSVNVIVWSVSPIVTGHGGGWIAYIDANTGALHLVRSDRQGDQVIDQVTTPPAKGHTLGAAFWSKGGGVALRGALSWSPTGQRLAYVVAAPDGQGVSLTVATFTAPADPSRPLGVSRQSGLARTTGFTTNLTWSADGAWLGFVQQLTQATQGYSQSAWLYDARGRQATRLTAQANAQNPFTLVTQFAVAPNGGAATWAVSDGVTTTGVFTQTVTAPTPTRLTPDGAKIGAAAVSVTGVWLVWDNGSLATVAAFAPADSPSASLQTVATLGAPARPILWAPTGAVAAIVSQGALSLWSPTAGLTHVATSASLPSAMAWSADGQRLAFQLDGALMSARISGGGVTTLATLGHSATVISLVWSPDGQALATSALPGVTLTTSDGAHTTQLANYLVDIDGVEYAALMWSIAG